MNKILRNANNEKIIIYGSFDLLNKKVVNDLKILKQNNNNVIVAVSTDSLNVSNKIAFTQNQEERKNALNNLLYVDQVVFFTKETEIEKNEKKYNATISVISDQFQYKNTHVKKIKNRNYLKDVINHENISNSKNIITYGTFDLFHIGHENILKRAKNKGDFLIVGISSDFFNKIKGKKSHENLKQRFTNLYNNKYVDLVLIEENWNQKMIDLQKYNIYEFIMGSDWIDKFDYLKSICKVSYLSRTNGVSTTQLKSKIVVNESILGFIIPIENSENKNIDKCLNSIENALNKGISIETIVLFRGRGNPHLIKQTYESDKIKILIETNEKNEKQLTINEALQKIKSKYVHILNPDNWININNLNEIINIINKNNLDIFFLNSMFFNDKNNSFTQLRKLVSSSKKQIYFEKKLPKNINHFELNTIIKREFLIKNCFVLPPNIWYYAGLYMNMWTLSKTNKIMWINKLFYYHRINNDNYKLSLIIKIKKNFKDYESTIYELIKLNYKENLFTYKHTKYFFSQQATIIFIKKNNKTKKKYRMFVNELKSRNRPFYNSFVFNNLKFKTLYYNKIIKKIKKHLN